MQNLIQTFLDLADIDETYPNEDKVLQYVENRLTASNVPYECDKTGNIIARIKGSSDESLAISGHVDNAAPLNGRKVVINDETIGTNGLGLLGGDDKTAIAAMLEIADEIHEKGLTPRKTLELVFTVGEEAGLYGAKAIDVSTLTAKDMLVFDWLGSVSNVVTKSPARYALDVEFVGKDAHPAEWKVGRNAGAALMDAATKLQQGEYAPGVIFTIGTVKAGDARNKIPGTASFQAELRSYDPRSLEEAARTIEDSLRHAAAEHDVRPSIVYDKDPDTFELNQASDLYKEVCDVFAGMGLTPNLEPTYGRFDGNSFEAKGMNVMILGAAYHNPHSPEETVNIQEFTQMYEFLQKMCL